MADEHCHVAIVGAGPAGLSAALTLARSLQPTIVFNSRHSARNTASPGFGGLLGRELATSEDLRGIALGEIERYGSVRFHESDVVRIGREATGGFTLVAADGAAARAERILLACGMVDLMPPIRRLDDFWGTSVINCPFCHGFELHGRPWGVIVNRIQMLDVAAVYTTWTDDLLLFVAPDVPLDADRQAQLEAQAIRTERRPVRGLVGDGTNLRGIELADGEVIERQALVLWPFQKQADVVATMGVPLDEQGYVIVDDGYRTQRSGIYAAGDLIYAGHQNVNTAIHMGALAAAAMVLDRSLGRDAD
ncbi:MAG: NAD(P)/FAD-dependent oxidoreductase [Pseudomonadota bacterium]